MSTIYGKGSHGAGAGFVLWGVAGAEAGAGEAKPGNVVCRDT